MDDVVTVELECPDSSKPKFGRGPGTLAPETTVFLAVMEVSAAAG